MCFSVPALNLRGLGDRDERSSASIAMDPYQYKLDTPQTGTTVRWI